MKMKIFKPIALVGIFLLLFSSSLFAVGDDVQQGTSGGEFIKVGASGGQFLKLGIGARANGMGGAYGAVANDLTSVFWNPAGLADIKGMSANFSYTQWFADYSHNFAALAMPLGGDFVATAHIISFSTGDIPITTLNEPEGTDSEYSVDDLAGGVTVSGYLTEQFSFGVTAKFVKQGFASLSSMGVAFDVGTMYETGIQGIKLGFSIHNLGTKQNFSGEDLSDMKKLYEALNAAPLDVDYPTSEFSLPLTFRAGVSSVIIRTEEHYLLAAFDFVTMSDVPEQFSVGAEYTWHNLISFRGGYLFGHDQLGLSGGVGIKYIGGGFKGEVNYSINPMTDLGLINRISIAVGME